MIDVPLKLALLVTARLAAAALVIPAVEESVRLSAVLTPLSCVLGSSAMFTAPAELNVRLPKFIVSPAWSPSVIDVPLKLALFATARLALAALVIPAVEESVRLSAVLRRSTACSNPRRCSPPRRS